MRKNLRTFSLAAVSVAVFFGGAILYQNYSDAAEKKVKEFFAKDGDVIRLSDDVSLVVNKKDSVEAEKPSQEGAKEESINSPASCPGDIIDLSNWKQTLPEGKSRKPTEIFQPALAEYSNNSYFRLNEKGDGVVFRAPVNGVTTSGSGYPRSELREMTDGGKKQAGWSTNKGVHTMYIEQAITSVPKKKKHVVAGQVHDADDDVIVIRLEYPKLFIDINGEDGPVLDENYELGEKFSVKFVAEDGKIKIYYNGSEEPAYTLNKKTSGCYFKAGAYAQSNCSKEEDCSDENYGEVVIYDLSVDHK